jgi:hypothetical protein
MSLVLRLMGSVTLLTSGTEDITPRGAKARALLVLLAMAPDRRMARMALQDKLYSDSAPEQGSAALRQLLRDLRIALGPHAGLVESGAGWLGLSRLVQVDLAPRLDPAGRPAEFCAGLDVADPEFDDWLRDTRISLEDASPDAPALAKVGQRSVLAVFEPEGADDQARLLGAVLVHEAAAKAAELIPAELQSGASLQGRPRGQSVHAICLGSGNQLIIMVMLRDLASGTQIMVQRHAFPRDKTGPALHKAMPVLTYAIVQSALRFAAPDQPVFPLSDLFSFSRDRLIRADRRLAMAPEIGEGAMGLSMRVYLRYTLILERQADDPQSQLAEAEDFINRATILAPADATVMSLSALFHSWKRDVAGALDMARLALRLCPDSDLAQHVLSQALTDAGRDREALDMAMRAGHGPMGLVGQATWLLRRMVSHLRLGQLEQAEQAAAAARAHAPDNRPSLRFLAALRWRRGDEIGTADALARLRLLEPDFTLDLMASPDYPVTTLRQMGLLDVTRSGL